MGQIKTAKNRDIGQRMDRGGDKKNQFRVGGAVCITLLNPNNHSVS